MMVNWKVIKAKPRYEDSMEDMFSKELNQLDFPNPLIFGSTDHGAILAQNITVQQESERTHLTKFLYEFNDFSTPPNADLLKKMRLDVGPSSHPSVKKLKIVEEPEKVDMKFSDLQKLMLNHYTDFLEVVKEGFASYGKVAHYPVHKSEKDIPNKEGDPPQYLNEHNTDAKSDNIVKDVGQPSKVGGNEGGADECLKDCGLFVAAYAEFLSDGNQISSPEFDPQMHRTRYASLLWDYGVNKASNESVSYNQDSPRPKHTFIPSEDIEMIDVEL
ncbi:hypothetical protein CQW23_12753 [Capsicum baccatum]|uniref:Ubiquitin-like protease family profile domain-containing protein n=1 Tax=Capsicum baccatum TaxID=33114 RepID=A0A2G2WTG6_CAPBA|nr:hypothetical protein CQW23_12753 [Capsicum baccatum]